MLLVICAWYLIRAVMDEGWLYFAKDHVKIRE